MLYKLSVFIYKTLYLIDLILKKLFKKEILLKLKSLIEKDSYKTVKILGKDIVFFVPNELINWRVETLFEKEPETLDWINKFQNEEKIVFWDIGSNIGLYSIYSAIKHEKIKIISFEPSTSNLRVLSRNISINNFVNKIDIVQIPLCSEENTFNNMKETSFVEGGALNVFGENHDFDGKKINAVNNYNIFGTNINFFLKNKLLEIPKYIKIDVDGIEHLILKGSIDFFNNENIKSVLIELNENFEMQFNSVMEFMKKNNFKFIEKKRAEKFYSGKFSKSYNYIFER
ncbi:MAG: FkbM family methyltransferase [Pelagibacterales bacterium]|nr:FkbM family methyltransferase [Pelagibacterales bacterium]